VGVPELPAAAVIVAVSVTLAPEFTEVCGVVTAVVVETSAVGAAP